MRLSLVMPRFLLMLVMAFVAGCSGSLVHSDDRDAVEALEEGGLFEIQLHADGKARVAVLKDASSMTDDMMAHFSGLDALDNLVLRGAPITDAGIAHIANLSKLERLILASTGITDAGLAQLEGLELDTLDVTDTKVTEDAAEEFKEKTKCEVLYGEAFKEKDEEEE